MVKIGKLSFGQKKKTDDASHISKQSVKSVDPAAASLNTSTPHPDPIGVRESQLLADANKPSKSNRLSLGIGKTKSKPTPATSSSAVVAHPAVDESRDEQPSTFPDEAVSVSDYIEQSFEESVSPSDEVSERDTYDGTVGTGTYDDEISQRSDEDDEDYTYDETATNQDTVTQFSSTLSLKTAKGDDISKKYFHKDVVLNSLEDGANSLVIRAMYFIPKPKFEDHVVVKIEASTISARDCMKCKGHGLTHADLPFVPGYEVVGTVQTLGDKVKANGQFRDGDRVAGVSNTGGGNSRFISIPASHLTKISSSVKSTQAVCMIHDYMAALKALRAAKTAGSPFTGMNMLITDGFSPVGQAIINLAGMEGAEIYCCADESKHAYLASLGAKCFVKNPEVWLPAATGTFDVVIDNSCIDSYSSSWLSLNPKGKLVCLAPVFNIDDDQIPATACGFVELAELQTKWAALKAKYMMTKTSFLNTVTTYDEDTDQFKQDLRYLMFLLERGDIKPKVAERVSLDDVPDAQRLMQSGRANGTVVCVPWIEE